MKRTFIIIATLLPLIASLYSCEKDSTIGSSLISDQTNIIVDSSFTISGQTVNIGKIQSRTTSQLLGRIDAKGFGRMSSDVVTQFMPAAQLDKENIKLENIDSLHLILSMYKGEFIGDSVAPLGLDIYPLKRLLPSPIYSDFNPEDYYSPDDKLASTIYNVASNTAGVINENGYTDITVKLPVTLARKLYSEYLSNPATFASPTEFAKFFPGFYIKNSFGSGRLIRVTSTLMTMYYHYTYTKPETNRDTTVVKAGNYFAVTPEIITNNNITLDISPEIEKCIADGEKIVMAPVGLEVDFKFPAPEIIAAYKSNNSPAKVLNKLTFSIPGSAIENDCGILAPRYLLLILKKEKEKFFANNTLPDNVTSFYATYNTTTGIYDFGEMRKYILSLMDKDNITEDDYTFSITPVSATFETTGSSSYYGTPTQTLSMLTPYAASPVMATLDFTKAKIKLTYSSQAVSK